MKVGPAVYLAGAPALLPAFFATVAARLEPHGTGTRFPMLTELASGRLESSKSTAARRELEAVDRELDSLQIGDVVSDARDDAWIVNGRFVTIRGGDLVGALLKATDTSEELGEPMIMYSDFLKRI